MAEFVIRDARTADREHIAMLWRDLMRLHHSLDPRFTAAPDAMQKYIRHVQDLIRARNARVLVACDPDGAIIGYIVGELQERPPIAMPGTYGFVSDVFVTPGRRRHGVGRALFTEMKRWFIDRKATAIELYIADANPAAAAFWRSMTLSPFLTLMHLDL